jgi:hypothetical protein
MWNQALNKRLQTTDLGTTDAAFYASTNLNLTFQELLMIPEQDSWYYSDGYSMVCDVFVCSIWKAAGLFGDLKDEIQCTEFTVSSPSSPSSFLPVPDLVLVPLPLSFPLLVLFPSFFLPSLLLLLLLLLLFTTYLPATFFFFF